MGLGRRLGLCAVAFLLAGCGPEWAPLPDIEAPPGATVVLTLDQDDLQVTNGVAEATFPLAVPRLPTRGVTSACVSAPSASAAELARAKVHFEYLRDGKPEFTTIRHCSSTTVAESGTGTVTPQDAAARTALKTATAWELRVRAVGRIRFEAIVFEAEALD